MSPLLRPSLLDRDRVPRIFVGTERLGSVLPDALASARAREQTFRFLDEVVEAGCTAFDLAASYQLGGTERLFGHWMRSRKNRDRLFLSGKGAHPYPLVRPSRLTARELTCDLDDSLRRLGTDFLDLYLVHRDSPGVPLEPIVEALVGFVRAGKIGGYGVSNWTHARIAELDRLADEAGAPRPSVSSPQLSLVVWTRPQWSGCVSLSGDAEARAWYTARQLPTLAWSPLGRGYFGARGRGGVYDSPENDARRARAEQLARERGATPAQIALAYLFHQPFPVLAVVSSRRVDNMKKNLEATRLTLTAAEVRWLEAGDDELAPRGAPRQDEGDTA